MLGKPALVLNTKKIIFTVKLIQRMIFPGAFTLTNFFEIIKNESTSEIDTAKTLKAKLCTRHDTEVFTATRIDTVEKPNCNRNHVFGSDVSTPFLIGMASP